MSKILDNYKKTPAFLKASGWFVFCVFLQRGITILTTPIFTRILTESDYGRYNIFTSWMEILTVFITLRLPWGVYMQGFAKFSDDKVAFKVSFKSLYNCLNVVALLLYLLFHKIINNIIGFDTVEMVAMSIIIWSTGIYSFWSFEQRMGNKYKSMLFTTLIIAILQPVLSVIFIVQSEDKVLARIIVVALVSLLVYGSLFVKELLTEKQWINKKYWKYALSFNIPLIPHYLSTAILNNSDKIMIENIINDVAVGVYSLAYSLSMMMMVFNTALLQVVEPLLYKSIKLQRFEAIQKISYPLIILIAGVNTFIIAIAPELLVIFAPSSYFEAVWIVPPVAMSVYFIFLYSLFAAFEFYYEKKNYILISTLVAAVLNILLNYIFINMFGYLAAGYTTLFCYLVYALLHYIYMKKIIKIHIGENIYSAKKILNITFLFIIVCFVLLFSYNFYIVRYMLILTMIVIAIVRYNTIRETIITILNIKEGV